MTDEKPRRCRLLVKAQIAGAIRDPGYVFTLQPGERGPHRTVRADNSGAAIADHGDKYQLHDEPLFVVLDEPQAR